MTDATYVVFSVYYKHGGYAVERIITESKLRTYLIENICERVDDKSDDLHQLTLPALVKRALKVGAETIEEQTGYYGIVSVVKGDVVH
jgi:hypothetical protein